MAELEIIELLTQWVQIEKLLPYTTVLRLSGRAVCHCKVYNCVQ